MRWEFGGWELGGAVAVNLVRTITNERLSSVTERRFAFLLEIDSVRTNG